MYQIGQRVVALKEITESGDGPGSKTAVFSEDNYIHAVKGDVGEIISVDLVGRKVLPTVRFDRTGTATLVFPDEVE